MDDNLVSATELERQVFELEEIRVVIRNNKAKRYNSYSYSRKAPSNTSLTDWYQTRLKRILGEDDAVIIDGCGNVPHGRTNIETVRNSYVK